MTDLTAEEIRATLLYPYLNHAVKMAAEGYATPADIDAAMRFGCGQPVGPLALADEIGHDTIAADLAARFAQAGEPRHQVAERLSASDGPLIDGQAKATPVGDGAREIKTVGVVGTGTMASGIATAFAGSGFNVIALGRSAEKADAVKASAAKFANRSAEKGKITAEEAAAVPARITPTASIDDLAAVDLVVEAIAEDLEIKLGLMADLERVVSAEAIIATTTSSLSVAALAAATSSPQRVIGMHFFNPATVMKLVEVVTAPQTSAEVLATTNQLVDQMGKVRVACADRAGFIVNCLLFPYLNDAIKLHESGVSIEAIDAAISDPEGPSRYPMGPFKLLDVVGLDISLAIQEELIAEFGDADLAPAKSLIAKVEAGELGQKTGKGFLDHSK